MVRVIARTSNGGTLLDVLTVESDQIRHRYRLVGAPDQEDLEFATLGGLVTHAAVNGIQLTITD
jgi:hypothetical protein